MRFLNLSITAFLVFLLTACGGGGGGGDSSAPTQPSNNSPTVNISGVAEADSGDTVSLTANATDSDGSIASYAWSVDSSSITLTDASKSQVSFIAPNVDSDTTISLSVTATDNKGAAAKAIKQITVKKKISVTVTGLVLDGGAIPNADVTFTIGDSTFATKANAAGQYSITISAGSKNANMPVVATAVDSAKPTVKLASQLYSVPKLIEQAGSDKTLDANENLSVNISNVTTAEYALLRKPSYWGSTTPITTDEQVQNAQLSIDSSQKISMASYLQILATDTRFKLPDTNKNTLDFLQDEAAVNTFYNQVDTKDSALASNIREQINADTNLVKKNGSIVGQYLLNNLSGNNSYRLTLNENLTGKLEGGNFTTSLTWIQNGLKVTLNFPASVETSELGLDYRFVIKSADLNFYNNYSDNSFASFTLFGDQIYSNGTHGYVTNKSMTVMAFNTSKLVSLTAEKIAGEWMSNYGNYQFNADNSALFKTYSGPNTSTISNWSLDNNKLVLKANNVISEEIYLLNDLGVGYSFLRISNYPGAPFIFSTGFLIKQQSNLQLKKSDFVGRWIDKAAPIATNLSVRIMSSDNLFFTNFGAWPTPWSNKEASNSWERNVYLLNNQWVSSCDLNAGTHPDCKLYRNYVDKVIAVNGDQYYSLHAEKIYENSDEPPANYSLVQSTKLPEITYFGQWIADSSIKVFYQKTSDGIKVWNFSNNQLIISDKSLADHFYPGTAINFSLSNNRLQYTRDNVARELVLVSASENGLTVCEYNQGSSCVAGTEILLSNRSPAKISLKVEGSGTVSPFTTGNPAALFGNTINFELIPDAGALVKSVIGCGGQLSNNRYITAEIRDACTITATFSRIPVITLKGGAHGTIKNFSGYEYNITPDVGYMVDTASGCNGVLADGQSPSYALKDVPAEDCTITVNFKQKLSVEAKIADPGLASCLDAANLKSISAVYKLNCENDVVRSLDGIQNLPGLLDISLPSVVSSAPIVVPETNSLTTLKIGNWDSNPDQPTMDVTSIDVSRAKNIGVLVIHSTRISSLNLNGLNKLVALEVRHNPFLESLDLSATNINSAVLDGNGLVSLILPSAGTLTYLDASRNKITNIDLTSSRKLTDLFISGNQLTQIDLTNNSQLSTVFAFSNQLNTISLANLEKLYYVDFSKNQLNSFDLRAAPKLQILRIYSNNLAALDASGFTGKVEITAYDNKLTTIKGLESVAVDSSINLNSNLFDVNTLAYLNNLKTVKNYNDLSY